MPKYGPLLYCFLCDKPIWADYKRVWVTLPPDTKAIPLHVRCAKKLGGKPAATPED